MTTDHLNIKRNDMLTRLAAKSGRRLPGHREAAPRLCDNYFGDFLSLVMRLWGCGWDNACRATGLQRMLLYILALLPRLTV